MTMKAMQQIWSLFLTLQIRQLSYLGREALTLLLHLWLCQILNWNYDYLGHPPLSLGIPGKSLTAATSGMMKKAFFVFTISTSTNQVLRLTLHYYY